jgi:outer membrane protein assembly factor BamB
MALDGRTGKTLWTLERESGTVLSSIVTDATHLLVVQEPVGLDGEPAVVAYDPVTGHEEFRARYPAGVTTVEPARDSLVGTLEESDEYAVLR